MACVCMERVKCRVRIRFIIDCSWNELDIVLMPQDATRSCGISDFEALLSRGIHFPERSDRKENPRPVFSFHHRTSVKYLRLWQMIGQVSQNGKPLLHRTSGDAVPKLARECYSLWTYGKSFTLCTLEHTDSMAGITERPPEVLPSHPSYQLEALPLHSTIRFRTFWITAKNYERSRKLCVKETERYPSEYRDCIVYLGNGNVKDYWK